VLKNKVLYILEKNKGHIVTGGQLASILGVSRNAVWKAVNTLKEEGTAIISIPNSGYKLMDTNDTLFEELIRENLTTEWIGKAMALLPTVHSTNQHLKEMDTTDIPSGYVVIANEQTHGRGRRSRTFLSPKSEGLYLSILLKLNGALKDIRLLTICTAIAVSSALEKVSNIQADIKWVNDIYCNGKKICGILTEGTLSGELQEVSSVIVGIGINTGRVPAEINDIATSVQAEVGIRGIRNQLAAEVLNQFEAVYRDFLETEKQHDIIRRYQERLFIIGKQVCVTGTGQPYAATVIGIDETGALIVRDDKQVVHHIVTGEITLEMRK